MPELRSIDKALIFDAFMEAFADYQMDASGTTEEGLLLRAAKNAVDFEASVGAYDGGKLVGFTMIGIDTVDGTPTAFDAGTGIVPSFRKQGLAKAMFDHALPGLRDRGVARFLLEVLQGNEPAIKAYTKSGFDIVRELRCRIADVAELRSLPETPHVRVEAIGVAAYREMASDADWTPSFENRFATVDAIPECVSMFGAFDGDACVGAIAYVESLHWMLPLVVRANARRRGVGRALVRHLAHRIPEGRERLAALNIDGADAGMQAFFDALGFAPLVDQYEMAREL